MLIEKVSNAFAYHKIVTAADGKAADYIFLDANSEFEKLFGLSKINLIGQKCSKVMPEMLQSSSEWLSICAEVARSGETAFFESRFGAHGCFYEVTVYSDKPGCFATVFRDISSLKYAENALRESEARYESIIAVSNTGAWEYHIDNDYLWCSPEYFMMLGYNPEDYTMDGSPNLKEVWIDLLHPDDRDRAAKLFADYLSQNSDEMYENYFRMINKDGRAQWFCSRGQSLRDPDGNPTGLTVGTHTDITRLKQAEEALIYQLQFEKLVADLSSYFVSLPANDLYKGIDSALKMAGEFFGVDRSYVFQFSADGLHRSVSHEWCHDGIEAQKGCLQGQPLADVPWWSEVINANKCIRIANVSRLPADREAEKREFELQNITSLICAPLVHDGLVFGALGFDSTITEIKWGLESEAQLKIIAELVSNAFARHFAFKKISYMSFHDQLTGLYNRNYLDAEMARLDTKRQLPISIIMADLNGLKLLNDTCGYGKGDELLKTAAGIMLNSCREEEIIVRWGGDEFVIFLPKTSLKEAAMVCRRITDNCKTVHTPDLPISIALGVACKTSEDTSFKELMREAEDNMFKQKLTDSRSTKNAVLHALLKTLAEKSYETEEHTMRMLGIARKIGERLELPESELDRLELLITLHDIGKINIDGDILTRQGALSADEWEMIKKHPEIGSRISLATEEFAHVAQDILSHHEHWDGSGYPRGLKGRAIPLLARITAIADAFEVMSNGRPYKNAMSRNDLVDEFKSKSGIQFDPEITEVFLKVYEDEAECYQQLELKGRDI